MSHLIKEEMRILISFCFEAMSFASLSFENKVKSLLHKKCLYCLIFGWYISGCTYIWQSCSLSKRPQKATTSAYILKRFNTQYLMFTSFYLGILLSIMQRTEQKSISINCIDFGRLEALNDLTNVV